MKSGSLNLLEPSGPHRACFTFFTIALSVRLSHLAITSSLLTQHAFLKHFQSAFFSSGMKRSFTAIHTKGKTTALGFTSIPTSVLPPDVTSVICMRVWRCSPLRQHHRLITVDDVPHPVTGVTNFMDLSSLFRCFRKTAKHVYSFSSCLSVCPSVLPYLTTRLPMDGFSWNLIFENLTKICWEYWSLIKIWLEKRELYIKTCVNSIFENFTKICWEYWSLIKIW